MTNANAGASHLHPPVSLQTAGGTCASAVFLLVSAHRRIIIALLCLAGGATLAMAQEAPRLREIVYKNFSLTYDVSLAKEYLAEVVPAMPLLNKTDKPDGVAPEHIMITFRDSYVPPKRREANPEFGLARVYVYPAGDPKDRFFDQQFPTTRKTVDDLKTYLSRRHHPPGTTVPFLPWADMEQAFIAKRKLIRFRNGRGVIFLTQYEQERIPVSNKWLVYTFQGLTDDNTTYVSVIFPVMAPGLPMSDQVPKQEAFLQGYDRYLVKTLAHLEKQPASNYTPNLILLENVVRSIKVSPR